MIETVQLQKLRRFDSMDMADKVHYTAHAELDKPDGFYHCGETAVCKVDFYRNGEKYNGRIRCRICIENKIVFSRNADYKGKPLEFRIRCPHPGWVCFSFQILSSHDRPLRGEKLWKHPRKPSVVEDIGAVFDPDRLHRLTPRPKDFDAFWERQKTQLGKIPFRTVKKELPVPEQYKGKVKLFAVTLSIGERQNATGYLAVPADAKPGSLRAELVTYGYGTPRQGPPKRVSPRQMTLWINAHGQELGRDDAYYKEFFRSIRTPKYTYAFNPDENKDPETAYFNGMALRVMRALEYLKSRPEWDGKNLKASGGSQGGLQTMWAAALDPDVNDAAPSITWCCDLAGQSKAGRIHGPWRIPYTPALDYYDPVFMAKRIKKAQVDIRRAGLGDYTCPPSGLAICYHNLATPKKSIKWVQGSDHGFVPKKSEIVLWKTY